MRKDIPVVPPDSVIHTFSHLKPNQAYLILTQDMDNIAHTSFLLRNTNAIPVAHGQPKESWSHYLLDAWFDPLYRAYAFQKAENHALEHIVQWHPTLLAKLVIIEQRLLNSYNYKSEKAAQGKDGSRKIHDSMWQPGDLVVNLKGCAQTVQRDCQKEMKMYFDRWLADQSSITQDTSTGGKIAQGVGEEMHGWKQLGPGYGSQKQIFKALRYSSWLTTGIMALICRLRHWQLSVRAISKGWGLLHIGNPWDPRFK